MRCANARGRKVEAFLMSRYYNCTIEPLQGREELCKFFQKSVSEKANKYNNRHVTLNERFSLIERGFKLTPFVSDLELGCSFEVRVIAPMHEVLSSNRKSVLRECSNIQG
uniref:HTH_48 domain-containing protein n=1 Tax=Syphacia muris TaxID=451379 RepID=A0A0N5AMC1_9BILA